jgi:adenylate cyclase
MTGATPDETSAGRHAVGEAGALDRAVSEAELAELADSTPGRIRELVSLGILEAQGGHYSERDVLRVRAVADLETMGIDAHGVAKALASGDLTLGYLEVARRRPPHSERTFAEVADDIGIPVPVLEKVFVATGLPRPKPDEYIREDDLWFMNALPVLLGAGVDEGEVLRAIRVWGDSARRVAQYQTHHLHNSIEEPFRRSGLRDNEAYEAAISQVGQGMHHSGEQMLAWLFRRHAERFTAEHAFEHAETALEDAGVYRRPSPHPEASVFADLSGYTRLTEESGDDAAARMSLTLSQLVSEIAARHQGEVVKMLGDGVFFHFAEPLDAVIASLEIVESARSRDLPPAHVGMEAGSMVYDEGDYFGRTVNLAARIASQAGPGQVFVGEELAQLAPLEGIRLIEVGAFDLKGIAQRVTLSEAIRDEETETVSVATS